MKLTKTQVLNAVYFVVCALAALATYQGPLAQQIPPTLKPYIEALIVGAGWIKSHWNLFVTPTGQKLIPVKDAFGLRYKTPPSPGEAIANASKGV